MQTKKQRPDNTGNDRVRGYSIPKGCNNHVNCGLTVSEVGLHSSNNK